MNAIAQNHFVGWAKLNSSISYIKDGVEILIPGNTEIFVDSETNVALIGADHVHVTSDEYTTFER